MDKLNLYITNYSKDFAKIMDIRDEVFVQEQGISAELEIDGKDSPAVFGILEINGKAVGTGRMELDGHIGRIAVLKQFRGKGFGMKILEILIQKAVEMDLTSIYLHSQYHARKFYEKAGFLPKGDIFFEANIEHIAMYRKLK